MGIAYNKVFCEAHAVKHGKLNEFVITRLKSVITSCLLLPKKPLQEQESSAFACAAKKDDDRDKAAIDETMLKIIPDC